MSRLLQHHIQALRQRWNSTFEWIQVWFSAKFDPVPARQNMVVAPPATQAPQLRVIRHVLSDQSLLATGHVADHPRRRAHHRRAPAAAARPILRRPAAHCRGLLPRRHRATRLSRRRVVSIARPRAGNGRGRHCGLADGHDHRRGLLADQIRQELANLVAGPLDRRSQLATQPAQSRKHLARQRLDWVGNQPVFPALRAGQKLSQLNTGGQCRVGSLDRR
jgi:hypothetical protein